MMGGAEERKTRNEKKNASPPKGRKKLDFRTPSPANSKPLKGKNIYLDLKNYRKHRSVENDLNSLGANVVTFFSKDIKFVITNQGQAKDYKDEAEGSSGVPSPAVSTPSPFNLGRGRSVNSPQNESPGAAEGQKVALTIRGKTIASKAKTFSARGSNDVLQNAKTFGAKILHVDSVLLWIVKEKEKLPQEQKAAGKPSAAKGKLPERLLKSKKLKNPFIKFESTNKHYRPIYKQLDSWPKLDASTPSGTCPFDGTAFRGGARAERAEREEGEERDCSEDRSSGQDKPKRDSSKPRGRTDSADYMDSGHIITAGEMRRKKDASRKAEQKRGFCELCGVKYDDIDKHVRVQEHQKFARNDKNYENLDELISGNGPTLEVFIKDLVTNDAEKREKRNQMRSKPAIDKTGLPRGKPSSKLSKSPRGQSGSKSCKSPSIRKKGARESPRLLSRKRNSPCESAVVGAEMNVSMDPEEMNNSIQVQGSPSLLVSEARKSSYVVEDFASAMSSILKESESFNSTETDEGVQVSRGGGATAGDCEVEVNNNVVDTAERNKLRRDSWKRSRSAQKQCDVKTDVSQNDTNSSKVEISEPEDPSAVIRRIKAEKTDSSEDTDTEKQASGVDSNILKSPKSPLQTLSCNTRTRAQSGEILSLRHSLRGNGSPSAVEGMSCRTRKFSGVHSSLESASMTLESTESSEASAETCEHVTVEISPGKDGAESLTENNSTTETRSKPKLISSEKCLPAQTVEDNLEEKENLRISPKSPSANLGVVVDDGHILIGIISPHRRSTRIAPVCGSPARMILDTPPQKNIAALVGDCDGMMEISSPQKKHGPHFKLSMRDENSPVLHSNVDSSPASSLICSGTRSGHVLISPGRALRSSRQVLPSPMRGPSSPTSSSYSPGAVRDSPLVLTPRHLNTPPSVKRSQQNSDDSASLNVLLSSPHHKKGVLPPVVGPLGRYPIDENPPAMLGHKVFIRGERISSPGRVILDRHRTDHRMISEDLMMGYEAVAEKVKSRDIDLARPPRPHLPKRLSRGKLEFKSNTSAHVGNIDSGGACDTDTGLAKVNITDTDEGLELNTDTDLDNAVNTDTDICSIDTNNDIGVKPDSACSTPCIGDMIKLSAELKAWDHVETEEGVKVETDAAVKHGRKKTRKSDLGKETDTAQTDADAGIKTVQRGKSLVTDNREDSQRVPLPRRTRSTSVESTVTSSESSSTAPEPDLEREQESPVVEQSRKRRKSQSLSAAGDVVQESTSKRNTRSQNTEDKLVSDLPVSSSRHRMTRSCSVEIAAEDSGRSKIGQSSVPRKHHLEEGIESVAVALRSVLKKCAGSASKGSNRDHENMMPASANLALGATADEQFGISERHAETLGLKPEENLPQNDNHLSSFAEEFDLVPLRITRKFFKDVSSGAFEKGSRSNSPVSSQSAVMAQSIQGKSRPRIKSSSSNASADLRGAGMEGSESCIVGVSEQTPTAIEPVTRDVVKSAVVEIRSKKKRRKLNRKAPEERLRDRRSSRLTRQPSCSQTNSVSHIRSGLLSPEPTLNVAKIQALRNGNVAKCEIEDEVSDQDFPSESEIGLVGGFELGSESEASSTWDQNCDSFVTRLCETPYGKLCGNSSATETSQDVGDTTHQDAARDMEVISHRRSPRITPRKVADSKEKDSPRSRVCKPNKLIKSAVAHSIKLLSSPKSSKTKTSVEAIEPVVAKDAVGESPRSLRKLLRNTHNCDEVLASALSSSHESEYPASEDGMRSGRKRKWKESNKMRADKGKKRIPLDRSRYRPRTEPDEFVSESESVKSVQDDMHSQYLSSADLETEADVSDTRRKGRRKSRNRIEHRIIQVDRNGSEVDGTARKSRQRTRGRVCEDEASEIPLQTDENDVNSPRGMRVNRALLSLKSAVDSAALLKSDSLAESEATDSGNGVSQSSAETCPVTPRNKRYMIAELVTTTPRSCRKDEVDMAKQLLKAATPRKRSVSKVILESIRMSSPCADLEPRLENEMSAVPEKDDECIIELSSPRRSASPRKYGQQAAIATSKQGASGVNGVHGESDRHLSQLAGEISPPVGSKLRLKRKRPLSSASLKNIPSGKSNMEISSFAVQQGASTPVQGRIFSLPGVGMTPGIGQDVVDKQKLLSAQKKMKVTDSEKDLEDSVLVVHMNSPKVNNSKVEEKATEKIDCSSRKSDPLTLPVLKSPEIGAPHLKGKDKKSKGSSIRKQTEIFLPLGSLKHIAAKTPPGEKLKSPKKKLLKKLSDRPKSYRLGMDRMFTTKTLEPSKGKAACGCSNNHGARNCKNQVKNSSSCVKQGKIIKNKSNVTWDFGRNPKVRNSPQRAAAQAANEAISSPQKTIYGSIKRKQPTSPSPRSSAHSAARKKLELAKSCRSHSPSMTNRLSRGTVASSAKVRQKLNLSPARRKRVGDKLNRGIDAHDGVRSARKVSLRERNTQIRYDYSDEDCEDQDPYSLI